MRSIYAFLRVLPVVVMAGVASANPINVAIVSALGEPGAAINLNIVNSMLPDIRFANITVLNAYNATPSLTDLKSYAAVMVVSGNYAFFGGTALGDALKQYVDDGYGVVLANYANCASCSPAGIKLSGAFDTSDYWALEPGAQSAGITHPTLGTIYVPTSPLLEGVSTLDGGLSAYYVNGAVNASATLVAKWSTGVPLIATRSFTSGGTVIGLNLYPPNNLIGPTFWVSTTNGGRLMANALAYAGQNSPGDGNETSDIPEAGSIMLAGFGLVALSLALKHRRR